jgi:hypothetical protein
MGDPRSGYRYLKNPNEHWRKAHPLDDEAHGLPIRGAKRITAATYTATVWIQPGSPLFALRNPIGRDVADSARAIFEFVRRQNIRLDTTERPNNNKNAFGFPIIVFDSPRLFLVVCFCVRSFVQSVRTIAIFLAAATNRPFLYSPLLLRTLLLAVVDFRKNKIYEKQTWS